MRYYVVLDPDSKGKPAIVDLIEHPSGTLEARIDARAVEMDVAAVGAQLSVRVDGQVIDLTTDGTRPELGAFAHRHRSFVRVESERTRAPAQAKTTSAPPGGLVVRAPMPGRVVEVLVAKGDDVKPGQGLIVLEAMKMENEVRAHTSGKVAAVNVAVGTTVERNAKLVTMA